MLENNGLEYEVCGDGEAVLLIHGSHVAGSFLALTREAALAEPFRLIRYHRRGFAGSAPLPASFSIEDQASDARSLLTHLGVERAHVIGHSYGGVTALQLALDAPGLIHSLTLLEPALLMVPSAQALWDAIASAAQLHHSGDTAGAVDRFLSAVGGANWRSLAESTVPGAPEQAERDGATFFDVEVPALQNWVFDADCAARISQPVMYVIGTESGQIFEEGLKLVRSWFPETREARVPGVNHLLQMQKPGLVAQGISEFLLTQSPAVSSR